MVNDLILMGLYEKAMPSTLSWGEKLALVKELGFDYLEMSIDESDEKIKRLSDAQLLKEVRKAMQDTGITIGSICLSALRRYALGSENENLRRIGVQIALQAMNLATCLGIRMIQLPGYDVYYEESNEQTKAYFLRNLMTICDAAAAKGILLGFETMETPFMDTIEKAMKYVSQIRSPYLQLYPDVGNLSNAMRLYEQDILCDIEKGSGHMLALHLKETRRGYYRNLNYGEGDCDFETILHAAMKQHIHRYVCELWYQGEADWLSILRQNCAKMQTLVSTCQKGGDAV